MYAEHQNAMYTRQFVRQVLARRQERARIDALAREAAAAEARRVAQQQAEQALKDERAVEEYRVIDVSGGGDRLPARSIIERVSRATGIPYAEIVGASRSRPIAEARMIAMYEVRKRRPDFSLPQIGRIFGGRDHTTVLHAVRKIEGQRAGESAKEAAQCA